jgi:hypothetical protein
MITDTILGLDISTSVIGYTFLGPDMSVVEMNHIDFKGCNTLWEKADHAGKVLNALWGRYTPRQFFIEESLQKFSTGMSSASTINLLTKFNGLVSYIVRGQLGMDPNYISVNHARKLCGIKVERTSKCGKSAKEQTFDWALRGPLAERAKAFKLVNTKDGSIKYQGYHYDEVDSYVIARAGLVESGLNTKKP